ncbi:endonuclease VIII [Thiolapillus brandeum]|uniref:DNA-(apurinic or apyrimidinic site) lyase n=1 Tax=Thiolapillus brandeum TaxID=1076588 RepID=A0A7U6JJJ7_9GAMM|nr:endonuclease VIII [Thiolapillus brandeum]BAO45652.1 endonuclease VIII [Thiolapillus brandeum]
MPEGPEIRRARDELAAAVEGQTAHRVEFHLPALKSWNGRFDGALVESVICRGKAMISRFSNGLSIYSHNQLYGRWMMVPPGRLPETRRQLRLAIHCERRWALLYSASDIEVWPSDKLHEHPFLSKLGPDLLAPDTTSGAIFERLESKGFASRSLGGLLTNQSFVAGLGNYLRCEILHWAGLHPKRRPGELTSQALDRLVEGMLQLPRQSYATGGITNDLLRAEKLMQEGAGFEDARFQVFRRAGLPCYRCGETIIHEPQGGQGCYLCPNCQY